MSTPTPMALAGLRKPVLTTATDTTQPAKKSSGFALIDEPGVHNGVVKAKHLKPGQTVRPFLHGEPKGSERVVMTVLHLGATVSITYSTPHPPAELKAAYRFYDASLAGTPVES